LLISQAEGFILVRVVARRNPERAAQREKGSGKKLYEAA
jgi:hypothetical protein